jgi:hypothetical protein
VSVSEGEYTTYDVRDIQEHADRSSYYVYSAYKVQILTQEQQMCHLQPLSVHPGRTVRAVTLACPLRTMRQVYSVDLLY